MRTSTLTFCLLKADLFEIFVFRQGKYLLKNSYRICSAFLYMLCSFLFVHKIRNLTSKYFTESAICIKIWQKIVWNLIKLSCPIPAGLKSGEKVLKLQECNPQIWYCMSICTSEGWQSVPSRGVLKSFHWFKFAVGKVLLNIMTTILGQSGVYFGCML